MNVKQLKELLTLVPDDFIVLAWNDEMMNYYPAQDDSFDFKKPKLEGS